MWIYLDLFCHRFEASSHLRSHHSFSLYTRLHHAGIMAAHLSPKPTRNSFGSRVGGKVPRRARRLVFLLEGVRCLSALVGKRALLESKTAVAVRAWTWLY